MRPSPRAMPSVPRAASAMRSLSGAGAALHDFTYEPFAQAEIARLARASPAGRGGADRGRAGARARRRARRRAGAAGLVCAAARAPARPADARPLPRGTPGGRARRLPKGPRDAGGGAGRRAQPGAARARARDSRPGGLAPGLGLACPTVRDARDATRGHRPLRGPGRGGLGRRPRGRAERERAPRRVGARRARAVRRRCGGPSRRDGHGCLREPDGPRGRRGPGRPRCCRAPRAGARLTLRDRDGRGARHRHGRRGTGRLDGRAPEGARAGRRDRRRRRDSAARAGPGASRARAGRARRGLAGGGDASLAAALRAGPAAGRPDPGGRRLRDAFARSVAEGRAQFVAVVGEAGIGKSRLARELADGLGDDGRVLEGRLPPVRRGHHLLAVSGRDPPGRCPDAR